MRRLKVLFWILSGISIFIFNCSPAFANGFKILGIKSTKATAMGEAFIAQADDPSAIAFNPAGLVQVEGKQVSLGGTLTNAWVKYLGNSGIEGENLSKWQVVPNFFITTDLNNDNLSAGLGITVPNGISSEWSNDSFARYVSTFADLTVIDINPSLAYKLNDNWSVGAGLSLYYSEAVLESIIDYGFLIGLPGTLDGGSRLEAKGDSFGYNFGILYKLNENHSFAATYKSKFTIDYKGSAKYEDIPAFMGLGSLFESDARTSINFPAVVVLGYAWRPAETLKLEFNLDWTDWETLNYLLVDFESNALADVRYAYEYEDSFAYKFGVEYAANDRLKLRAGYIYNQNAIPEENWRLSLPDTDIHFLCSGFGYQIGNFTIDGAVQALFYEDRTIDNNVDSNESFSGSSIDGKYENFALAYSVGITYRF